MTEAEYRIHRACEGVIEREVDRLDAEMGRLRDLMQPGLLSEREAYGLPIELLGYGNVR